MTSNVGAEVKSDGLGFQPAGRAGKMDNVLRQRFTPEFLGRLDRIVHFSPLQKNTLTQIAAKFLQQLCDRAENSGIRLSLPENLAEQLAQKAEKKDGARQLRRIVQEQVEGPLAEFLLHCAKRPGKVNGFWENEKICFHD